MNGRAYYNEIDPYAAQWLRNLIGAGLVPPGDVDERDIRDVQPDDLEGYTACHFFAGIGGWAYALRLAGWPDDRPVWTGSPPCQPFSAAGQQRGADDDRHLAPHWLELVAACRPPVVFGEQVASAAVVGRATGKARIGTDGSPGWTWLDDLSRRLGEAQYAVAAVDIPAAGVGAPHIRQRLWFVASRLADADSFQRRPDHTESDTEADWREHRGRRGEVGRLADADKQPFESGDSRGGARGSGSGQGHEHDCLNSTPSRLADADGAPGRQVTGSASRDEAADGRAGRDRGEPDGDHRSSGHGEDRRLADAAEPRPQGGLPRSAGVRDQGGFAAAERGGARWLADAEGGGWREERPDDGGGRQGNGEEGRAAGSDAGRVSGRLADSDGGQPRQAGAVQPGEQHGQQPEDGGARGLADADSGGPPPRGEAAPAARQGHPAAADGGGRGPGPHHGGWDAADWLFCRDGKWRPVESGTSPLAHGVSARVGRLRAYGNAIVPQVAAEFIRAYLDIAQEDAA